MSRLSATATAERDARIVEALSHAASLSWLARVTGMDRANLRRLLVRRGLPVPAAPNPARRTA